MASRTEIQILFEQFEKARSRLKEAVNMKREDDIKRDAVIKRFEFTYEKGAVKPLDLSMGI